MNTKKVILSTGLEVTYSIVDGFDIVDPYNPEYVELISKGVDY